LMSLSMVMADAATIKIRMIRRKSRNPKKLSGVGVGVAALMTDAPSYLHLPQPAYNSFVPNLWKRNLQLNVPSHISATFSSAVLRFCDCEQATTYSY
jgi:hypothetical protein